MLLMQYTFNIIKIGNLSYKTNEYKTNILRLCGNNSM